MSQKKIIPEPVEKLTDTLASLPGIGPKSAFKLAVYLATNGESTSNMLSSELAKVRSNVGECTLCNNLANSSDGYVCSICADETRDENQLMIVETVADLLQIENSREFHGYYFVTERLISPLAGVTPKDISIDKLLKLFTLRNINEVIFAFAGSVEAESTSLYIKENLPEKNISVTRLGRGLPAAGSIEYLDSQTLKGAINARQKLS